MKMGLVATLSIGVGWIVGVTIMMIFMPLTGTVALDMGEALGNTFVFGFPGFVLFMIAAILSLRDDAEELP